MDSNVEQFFADANSFNSYFRDFLAQNVLLAIGVIQEIDNETNTATIRLPVNDPIRVYREYSNIEVLLPSGISCDLSNSYCLVFTPRTPLMINDKEGCQLYNDGSPFDIRTMKAIPLTPLTFTGACGAINSVQGFSMYTPFGAIQAAPDGLKMQYEGEENKAGVIIDPEGVVTLHRNGVWITLDEDDNIQLVAQSDDLVRTIKINPEETTLNLQDDNEEDILNLSIGEEGDISLTTDDNNITIDEDGIILENKKKDAAKGNSITLDDGGILVQDKNDNKITMDNSGTVVEDANQNTITMDSSGIVLKDAAQHKITMGTSSIKLEGTSGSVEIT